MRESNKPEISVLLSVYNGAETISAAVESILWQTFQAFELIIIDDGSTDGTFAILEALAQKDSRIRLFRQENSGLTVSLNRGIERARGRYLARQDADDFSRPERLEKQYNFLEDHPDVALLGGNSLDHYEDGRQDCWGWHAAEALQRIVYQQTPFPHSTVMMRTNILREIGGYNEDFKTSQDMELWMRFARVGELRMLPDELIDRRVLATSISGQRWLQQIFDAWHARALHSGNGWFWNMRLTIRHIVVQCLPKAALSPLRRLKRRRRERLF